MVNFEILSVLIFVVVAVGLLIRDRKNIQFNYGFIIKRWNKGISLIDKLVKNHPKFITFLGNIGIGIGVLGGLLGFILLIFFSVQLQQTFGLVLPTAGGYQIPGPVVSVPFWYWLIAIFIIIFTHESMHAVFVRLEKVKVRNYGIFLFLIFPLGAFVDPDEKKVEKLSTIKKLRILAAGAFINIVTALLALGLIFLSAFLFTTIEKNYGVAFDSVADNSPASTVGLHGIITKVADQRVTNTLDLARALNQTKPGDQISITTNEKIYSITLGQNPENQNKSYIGIIAAKNSFSYNIFGFEGMVPPEFNQVFFSIIAFLTWLTDISFAVGIFNMLPVRVLDGGRFFGEIFKKLFGKKSDLILNITTILILLLVLFSLFGIPLVRNFIH